MKGMDVFFPCWCLDLKLSNGGASAAPDFEAQISWSACPDPKILHPDRATTKLDLTGCPFWEHQRTPENFWEHRRKREHIYHLTIYHLTSSILIYIFQMSYHLTISPPGVGWAIEARRRPPAGPTGRE